MRRPNLPQLAVTGAAVVLLVTSIVGLLGRDTGPREGTGSTAGARAEDVTIVDFSFDPTNLTVAVGDTVTWTNEDDAVHTVTSDGDGPLDSGDLDAAASYEATFGQPGTFAYICTIHPSMDGTVKVTG